MSDMLLYKKLCILTYDRLSIPIVSSIVDSAIDLIDKYGKSNHIFSLDAMQIAAFSVITDDNTTFVCADRRLTALVKSLGYSALEL
ncbi:MAG: hypothetical protein AB1632_12545 [Nitrospirota bacterium]